MNNTAEDQQRIGNNLAILAVDLSECLKENILGGGTSYEGFRGNFGKVEKVLGLGKLLECPIIATQCRKDDPVCDLVQRYITEPEMILTPNKDKFCMKPGEGETNLGKLLEKLDVGALVVLGYHRDYCVLETTKSAVKRGYNVITSKEIMFWRNFPIAVDMCRPDLDDHLRKLRNAFFEYYQSLPLYCETAEDVENLMKKFKDSKSEVEVAEKVQADNS